MVEVFTGTLPQTRIQSTCRCPEEYPALTGKDELYCAKNPPAPHPESKYRVNDYFHPPEFVNDGKLSTFWVSAIKEDNVALSIDLQDQYEVCDPKTECSYTDMSRDINAREISAKNCYQ